MFAALPIFATSNSWALFLDIDGTLLDIAQTPDQVEIPPDLTHSLRRVSRRLDGALAMVSGRAIAWIDRAFHPLCLAAAGQHGSELRLTPGGPILTKDMPNLDTIRAGVLGLSWPDGIEIEDKGVSIAIHYRRSNLGARIIGEAIAAIVAEDDSDFEILPGLCVYEIKARGFNKGTAIAELAAIPPFLNRVPIFVGDDRTDQDGFREVLKRNGVAIQVGPAPAPPNCRWIESPAAMRHWLTALSLDIPISDQP